MVSLVNALAAQLARVRAVVPSLANAAAGALRSALQIGSPSRVITAIGNNVVNSFLNPTRTRLGEVANAAAQMAKAIVPKVGGGLTGQYTYGDNYFKRLKGSLGGAILNDWERLTDGFYRNVTTGLVKKGSLAEDGSYVVPGFHEVSKSIKTLDRTLGRTATLAKTGGAPSPYADLFRDRQRLSATDYSVRNGRFTEHYGTGMTSTTIIHEGDQITVHNPTLEEQTWLDHQRMARQGQQAAAVAQRGRFRTSAQTGQRAPMRTG